MTTQYKVRFRACDGANWTKTFKTSKGLRKAITHQIGDRFDISLLGGYATDGFCTARIAGITWRELFPEHFDHCIAEAQQEQKAEDESDAYRPFDNSEAYRRWCE
jgi:hypothetical protein